MLELVPQGHEALTGKDVGVSVLLPVLFLIGHFECPLYVS